MDRWVGSVALVTGASSGIGEAICRRLVILGVKVVGAARRIEKLDKLAQELNKENGKFYARKCDLTNEDDIRNLFKWMEEELGGVDVCINNAGYSTAKSLTEESVQQWKEMMDVNVLGLCLCTQLSVESMKHNNVDNGQIIMVSSLSAHRVGSMRFYAATKHAVKALVEGWRQELRDLKTNIRVAAISPGLVETEFQSNLYPDDPDRAKQICGRFPCLQPDDVVDSVVHILAAPEHVQIHDILLRPTQQMS